MQPKTVLITGCSSGIGRAAARAFLEEEWVVYATARDTGDLEDLAAEGCETARLDVTRDRDVERVVDRMVGAEGRIDCLVNNAGYGQYGPVEDVPVGAVERQFDVNVFGPHRLTRAVLPQMRRQGDGTVVNVSSAAGRVSVPAMGVYCGSKAAMEAMTDALRGEVAEYGINAVLVEPGPVETAFAGRATEATTDGGTDGAGPADDADPDPDARGDREASPPGVERSDAYDRLYDDLGDVRAIASGGPGAVSAERVAAEVVNAASATRPEPRYRVGPVATLAELGRLLPDRWRDRGLALLQRLQ